MPDINITVAHKVAVSDTTTIVCDNSDYTVRWTLDDEWSAYDTKTMRTIYMDGTYTDTVFSGVVVALPVCTVPGAVQIGLFAGDIRTSRVAILRALPSVRSGAGAPADPTESVYDQLMDLIKGLGGVDPEAIKTAVAEYLTEHPIEENDPTVPAWAKEAQKPSYTASEVGADPSGTASAQVATHNTAEAAHNDIRLLISGLTDRLNALADSDDTTLDQLSEVVAYIKSNRGLIEAITTSKVSVADIVDNLTTNVTNKPLSAAQGVVIKTLIDALRNDKLDAAELTNAVNTALAQAKESGEFDGAPGPAGPQGEKGAGGKSAYQYAVEGGYTGTEAEFAAKLATEKFANPNALTFTGAVTGSYDGSATLSVKIPSAVTDDHINSLINTKLGVIENGAY